MADRRESWVIGEEDVSAGTYQVWKGGVETTQEEMNCFDEKHANCSKGER